MTLPTITVTGNLAADPELRFVASGTPVAGIRIGCSDRKLNRQTNEWEDGDTLWLTVSIWKAKGEAAAEQLRRGDLVTVTGKLRMRQWERDGQRQTAYEIDADTVAKVILPSRDFQPATSRTATSNDVWQDQPGQAPF